MPRLYLVATPIGNLEDITLRAINILRTVRVIAAEDTRRTRKLLQAYEIKTPMTSYHEQGGHPKVDYLLQVLSEGDVALVSEAGMPGISDPGYELVVAAVEQGIQVVPIPGASAIVAALAASGLPNDQFVFVGFLPRQKTDRKKFLKSIANETRTILALEAPHRLRSSLDDLQEVLGDRRISVCRELTKLHEEIFRGAISQALEHFSRPKGEFTLVIEGLKEKERGKAEINPEVVRQLRRLRHQATGAKKAVTQVAATSGLSRRELYQAWLQL